MDFPGLEGFEVEVANLSRKELTALRKRCISQKFDRKSRVVLDTLDEDKFVTEFTKATVKNWKGLTLEHLETLILIDTTGKDLSEEVKYSTSNAEVLVSQSTEFDTWLNEVIFDLENFRSRPEDSGSGRTEKAVSES